MPQATHAADTAALERGRLAAVGSIIWRDRALLLATAARAGAHGAETVECGLRGASMAPAIPAGSRLRIACGQREPRRGDVVAFAAGDCIVVHRVAYRRRAGRAATFLTRGDARAVPDPPLVTSALIGQVVAFDAGAGWSTVGAPGWTPRRQRVLAFALLAASAALLELRAGLARRFIARLDAIANRIT